MKWTCWQALLCGLILSGTIRADGALPFPQPGWRCATSEQPDTRAWIEQALDFARLRQQAVIPAAVPISASFTESGRTQKLLIYRSHRGLHAVNLQTGEPAWQVDSPLSLDLLRSSPLGGPDLNRWVRDYQNTLQQPTLLFESSTAGTLSSDQLHVYAIEDLEVTPPPLPHYQADTRFSSRLRAYELATGKPKWDVDGRDEKQHELTSSWILGPPLPLAGKLCVLTQKDQDLRLVCLDPHKGTVLATRTLAAVRDRMQSSLRRRQAVHLAEGDGVLVCPTNVGVILGVDAATWDLNWVYPYREQATPTPSDGYELVSGGTYGPPHGFVLGPGGRFVQAAWLRPHWQVSRPVIQDGKVVFTAPDAGAVHCLNLKDGSRVWSQERRYDDLYLAGVVNGKVLIVGTHQVRALSLATGKPLWSLQVGVPSGQGVARNNVYYLPLRAEARSGEPAICAIDVDRGTIHARTTLRQREAPGNLIFAQGMVVAQGLGEIVAYSRLDTRLAQVEETLKNNSDDITALAARGKELQGKRVEALEKYLEFAARADRDKLISLAEEPNVRVSAAVWAQGRIRAMLASATPEEQNRLDQHAAGLWQEWQARRSLGDLRTFVEVFGWLSRSGKEARLQLAERLLDDPERRSQLEAERHLYLLRGPGEEPALQARGAGVSGPAEYPARPAPGRGPLLSAAAARFRRSACPRRQDRGRPLRRAGHGQAVPALPGRAGTVGQRQGADHRGAGRLPASQPGLPSGTARRAAAILSGEQADGGLAVARAARPRPGRQ